MFFYIVDQGRNGERAFLSNLPQSEFEQTAGGKVVGRVAVPEEDRQYIAVAARTLPICQTLERLALTAWQWGQQYALAQRGHDGD